MTQPTTPKIKPDNLLGGEVSVRSIVSLLAVASVISLLLPQLALSKGLNSLQPEAEKETEDGTSDKTDGALLQPPDSLDSEKNSSGEDEKGEPQGKSGDASPPVGTKGDGTAMGVTKTAPLGPVKGHFSAGLSLGSTKVGAAETHALVGADLGFAYQFLDVSKGGAVLGTFRYAATDFDAIQDDIPYRGVAEVYAFGATYRGPWKPDVFYYAGGDVGYVKIGLRDLSYLERNPDIAKGGAVATITGGINWVYGERTALGPKVYAGLGRVRTFGLGVSSSFMF